MRALSERAASSCEHATTKRCQCRCGGALHGVGRTVKDAGRWPYEALPQDDPHHLPTEEEQAEKKRQRQGDK